MSAVAPNYSSAEIRILGVVESASESFPGSPASYAVAYLGRDRSARTATVKVVLESNGESVVAKAGDVVRILGEPDVDGSIVVTDAFGEFAIIGATPLEEVERPSAARAESRHRRRELRLRDRPCPSLHVRRHRRPRAGSGRVAA